MKSDREALREAVADRQNGHRERDAAVAVLEHDDRANQGNPEITRWCPTCEERAIPMRDGTCGFCDTPMVELDIQDPVRDTQDLVPDAPGEKTWPHTEAVVRRRVPAEVSDTHAEVAPARGPIIPARNGKPDVELSPEEQRQVAKAKRRSRNDAAAASKDSTRSPIVEWLEKHGKGTASQIAETLERAPGNVSTRLRQLEAKGDVRRTGRSVPGGRGGPQVEWELADFEKEPTSPGDELASPLSVTDFRVRYFEALLARFSDRDCPAHIFDRLERLCGVAQ